MSLPLPASLASHELDSEPISPLSSGLRNLLEAGPHEAAPLLDDLPRERRIVEAYAELDVTRLGAARDIRRGDEGDPLVDHDALCVLARVDGIVEATRIV